MAWQRQQQACPPCVASSQCTGQRESVLTDNTGVSGVESNAQGRTCKRHHTRDKDRLACEHARRVSN